MVDWTTVLLAMITGLPATVAAIGALLLSLRNGNKIDDNTAVTKEGTKVAAINAKVAASAASLAAEKAVALSEQVNGMLDSRIRTIAEEYTKPLVESIQEIKQMLLDMKYNRTR